MASTEKNQVSVPMLSLLFTVLLTVVGGAVYVSSGKADASKVEEVQKDVSTVQQTVITNTQRLNNVEENVKQIRDDVRSMKDDITDIKVAVGAGRK